MQRRKLTHLMLAGVCAAACLMPAAREAAAQTQEAMAPGPFDGSRTLICANRITRACIEGRGCGAGRSSDFDIPTFMVVDFAGKEVRPTQESGHDQTSEITHIDTANGRTIIQGVEEGRGWAANIDQSSGHFTVGVVGHGYTVSIVGECTIVPDVKG